MADAKAEVKNATKEIALAAGHAVEDKSSKPLLDNKVSDAIDETVHSITKLSKKNVMKTMREEFRYGMTYEAECLRLASRMFAAAENTPKEGGLTPILGMLCPESRKSKAKPGPDLIPRANPNLIPSTGVFSRSDLEREGQLLELGGYDFATQESSASKIPKYRPRDWKEKLAKFVDDQGKFIANIANCYELSGHALSHTNTEISTKIEPYFPATVGLGQHAAVSGGVLEVVVMYQIMKDSVKRLMWGANAKKMDDIANHPISLDLSRNLTQFRIEQAARKK